MSLTEQIDEAFETVGLDVAALAAQIESRTPMRSEKASDQSVSNSASAANDNDLALSVDADSSYYLTGFLIYDAPTDGDIKMQWNVPAGTTMQWTVHAITNTASGTTATGYWTGLSESDVGRGGGIGVGSKVAATITGRIDVGGTGGTVRLQWAQNVASATGATTIFTGSWLRAEPVGN